MLNIDTIILHNLNAIDSWEWSSVTTFMQKKRGQNIQQGEQKLRSMIPGLSLSTSPSATRLQHARHSLFGIPDAPGLDSSIRRSETPSTGKAVKREVCKGEI
ncbi:hydrophobin 1 [Histoplasma capsulatum G186AR]|uniref:Hydrophobin 1 n=1 Tax=Ajellomyces capsulatus TaxID=5037 RepID=A0A8H8D3V2_AJECA|nr:hydrophobin 1 [Histoplasma capsulatum]QSS67488.1 hydrophobin 1 [Histoplasma capsulatum G186AR]